MGGFDTSLFNAHKHIDIALCMKQQGYAVFVEPAAQINFLSFVPYMLDDLPIHRRRWAQAPTEASIRAFCEKWQVLDHPLAFDGLRSFVYKFCPSEDPIRLEAMGMSELNTAMQRHELGQTRSDLLDQATMRGYTTEEIGFLSKAYDLAQSLTNGGYRPCGRPFINHLVGTASVLIRYGFKVEIVLAGMLHTLYSHSPKHNKDVLTISDMVPTLPEGISSAVISRVQAYTRRGKNCDTLLAIPTSRLTVLDAEVIVMAVANQIDMRLSGEMRYSGRDDALPEAFNTLAAHVCRVLEVGGLAQTFAACKTLPAIAPELVTKIPVSYYMVEDKEHTVSMTSNLRPLTGIFSGDTGLMGSDAANTSSPINADAMEQWLRCVIILREPLVVLSSPFSKPHPQRMLGCAALLPQFFVGRPSFHLISFDWSAITCVSQILENLHWAAVNLPLARFCYLASDVKELFALQGAGVDACMGNLNIFIDERVFRPLPAIHTPARYDAVYDARFSPFKNHRLCSEIKKLALIYYSYPGMSDNEAEVRQLLPRASYINHEHGQGHYRKLSPTEVNVILNQSSVGLCLSHEEGSMRASMQYLLAGTPVITVPSEGGRERYLLPPYAQVVDADARNIARAVERFKVLKLPRAAVREYAATLVSFERRNFLQALNLRIQKMFASTAKITDFSVFDDGVVQIYRPLKESLKALL